MFMHKSNAMNIMIKLCLGHKTIIYTILNNTYFYKITKDKKKKHIHLRDIAALICNTPNSVKRPAPS